MPGCVWRFGPNGTLAIPLSAVPPTGLWSRGGRGGLVWRAGDPTELVDEPSAEGTLCFSVRPPTDGHYYVTAHSAAPHRTEHNDAWLSFSGGIDLFRAGTHVLWDLYDEYGGDGEDGTHFMKVYENEGDNVIADMISSIDGYRHVLVTRRLLGGEEYELCIAGRSSKYTMFSLVLVRCEGIDCQRSSAHVRRAMSKLEYSQCD